MNCGHCGKKIPKNSKFCRFCGRRMSNNENYLQNHIENDSSSGVINSKNFPYPYLISTNKLIILSLTTFGVFDVYWFYRHFKSFKAEDDWKITPWARALFCGITSYSLFKHVSDKVKTLYRHRGLNAGSLAVLYFILTTTARLPEPFWFLFFLGFIPLIPAQNVINYYWTQKYGDKVEKSRFGTGNLVVSVLGGLLILLVLYGLSFPE